MRWTSRRSSSAWPRMLTPQPPCRLSAGKVVSTANSPQAACGPGRLGRHQRASLPRFRVGCRGRRLFLGIAGGEHGSATRTGAHDRRQQRRAGRSRGQWHGIPLYLSGGPLLYAVTGVAPDSGSDPRADIEAIATALLAPTPVQVQEVPTATPAIPVEIPPTMAPIPTATPLPTMVPVPIATSTPIPPPTAAPMRAALPTATPIPTLPPPPTVAPTPIPTAMVPAAPPQPTATTGPLPTATPRVIRPPTPAAG